MKLLNRTVKNYLVYSVLLVLVCTPLFYFTIQHLFIAKMDKELNEHKEDFHRLLPYFKSDKDRGYFHLMNKEFTLKPVEKALQHDSLFIENMYNREEQAVVPHRTLISNVRLQDKNYILIIRESLVSDTELIAAIMSIEIVMLFLLICGLVLINRRLSKKVWEPFYTILDRLRKYQIDQHLIPDFPHSTTAEFRELSQVIRQLILKNHDAYLSQKEFTENASHELQTPLAICRSKIELLAQTRELTHEQAELIGNLLDATDRISRLNKNLLLLSKIENRQFFETEPIDVKNATWKSMALFMSQAHEKKLVIETSFQPISTITGNTSLFDILITNLVSNAIRYTPECGKIYIYTGTNYISIQNEGAPLEHPEKVFNRFHRESRNSHGNGLGLSIVKKIADVSGYKITYTYQSGLHQFTMEFRNQL
ncbi:MAG TPA: HAMP domain-containing sensor histidine kinase [Ohtaekwangia sp.]|uniref:sensor histidine kinase n=1 Tax=Ohtaekwangia sp. TaxID=2066019 RepID=UPI002F92A68E